MKFRAYAWLTLYIRSSLRFTQWFLHDSYSILNNTSCILLFSPRMYLAQMLLFHFTCCISYTYDIWDFEIEFSIECIERALKERHSSIISGRIRLIAHWYYTFYAIVLDPIYDIGFGIHSSSTFLDWHNELHIVCFKFM